MHLVVVTSVIHYSHDNQLFAYGPYAREIEMWSDLFSVLTLAAPLRTGPPPNDCVPFLRHNIRIRPQREAGGRRTLDKLAYVWNAPAMVADLCRTLFRADAIHVRCPGNIGLLGVLLSPLFSRLLVAKYAGQWSPYPGEPLSVKLQRKLLASPWWRGPVTVYGALEGHPGHVVPFFTSVMTEEQTVRARVASSSRRLRPPLRLLYVGRLSKAKNVGTVLRALAAARTAGVELSCSIVGEGPERTNLESLTCELRLAGAVEFMGGLLFEDVLREFERADILALVSETEGWPKAIMEAMAFGLVCIGSDRGMVPQLLAQGRGIVVPAGNERALAEQLVRIAADTSRFLPMIQTASAWAQQFSLEKLRESIRELLERSWGQPLAGNSTPSSPASQPTAMLP